MTVDGVLIEAQRSWVEKWQAVHNCTCDCYGVVPRVTVSIPWRDISFSSYLLMLLLPCNIRHIALTTTINQSLDE